MCCCSAHQDATMARRGWCESPVFDRLFGIPPSTLFQSPIRTDGAGPTTHPTPGPSQAWSLAVHILPPARLDAWTSRRAWHPGRRARLRGDQEPVRGCLEASRRNIHGTGRVLQQCEPGRPVCIKSRLSSIAPREAPRYGHLCSPVCQRAMRAVTTYICKASNSWTCHHAALNQAHSLQTASAHCRHLHLHCLIFYSSVRRTCATSKVLIGTPAQSGCTSTFMPRT
jgi:hypothetical protein